MKILVIGAGKMGGALVQDLARNPRVTKITVADRDEQLARAAAGRVREREGLVAAAVIDAADESSVARVMQGHDAAVGAADYRFNETLARLAIAGRLHFCDLGGNNTVVAKELAMDAAARAAGVTIVPDCGLAPGMVSVLVAHGLRDLERADTVSVRVGGLPVKPVGPLRYQLVFSVRGLTNEYLEPAVVLRNHELSTVPSLTEVEELEFPAPFGKLEAFQTSGGTSTLPTTYREKVRDLDYKTIRYPGHCALMKFLADLGMLSEAPLAVGGQEIVPRQITEAALVRHLPHEGADAVLVRVSVDGTTGGRRVRRRYQCVEYGAGSLTAMMRMTAFPASIIVQMMADGTITQRGAVPQELAVPPDAFLVELRRRNIQVEVTQE
ncbi:MAG: saccharopine dehydrogenase NADP-binding domain-containing protein [Candidatus Wallbacteria bacterium]|nr:saccharopine dehydrogenase NADP-binding domain-containing protein [Candidatus Wallbacteria bacterium]